MWTTDGRECFIILLFILLKIFVFVSIRPIQLQVSGCLPHKSLIGCYIKEVTNQADGERCHTVSILQGRCLSLREPTPSALTSNNPEHAHSACMCSRTCKSKHRYGHTHELMLTPILNHTCTCIYMQLYASAFTCTNKLITYTPIHISLGINVTDDLVQ